MFTQYYTMNIQHKSKKRVMLLMLMFLLLASMSSLALLYNAFFLGVVFLLAALGLLTIAVTMIVIPLVRFIFSY